MAVSIHVGVGDDEEPTLLLARESDRPYEQVIEVICEFVRNRSRAIRPSTSESLKQKQVPPTPSDIEVAMTILLRREHAYGDGERRRLDLRGAHLCNLELQTESANFAHANLSDAIIYKSRLQLINLEHASFEGAHLLDSKVIHCNLKSVELSNAYMDGMDFQLPREYSFLTDEARVQLAAIGLAEADLTDGGQSLRGADWNGTEVKSANMRYEPLQLDGENPPEIDYRVMAGISYTSWEHMTIQGERFNFPAQ